MPTSPALLSLLCLIAAGFLDLVFKLYASKQRSRGMLVCGIGCIWVVLQVFYMASVGAAITLDSTTVTYGLLAAVFVTVSNILLIECLSHLPVSMGSTVYRLNTIPLVLIAFLFLQEDIGLAKGAGIVMGLVTVFLLYQPSKNHGDKNQRFNFFLVLIIVASCIRALYGIFTKVGVNGGGDPATMMLLAAIGWFIGGFCYAYLREKRVVISRDKLVYIAIGGSLVYSVVWLLTTALTLGDASVVIPLTNMGFVAAFIFSVVMRLEKLTLRKATAVAGAVVSIVLLTYAI